MLKRFNKNLIFLLTGQLISQFGDKFYNIAITFWVYKVTNSPGMMALVLTSQMIGSMLTGLFAGSIVDTLNRKYILVVTDIIRSIIVALFAILFYQHIFNLPLIMVVEFLLGVNAAFFNAATPAVLPQIVQKDALIKANAKSQLIEGNMRVFGPILAGVITAAFGYGIAFIINSISFLLSALCESFIHLPAISQKSKLHFLSMKNKLIEGYRYIYQSRSIILLIIVVMIIHLFFGSILVILPIMAKAISNDHKGVALLGYFQAALGVGTIMTALLLNRFAIQKNEDRFMFVGFTGIGVMFCMIAIFTIFNIPNHFPVLIGFLFLSASTALSWISFRVTLQKKIEQRMMGRVFSVIEAICNSSVPLGMLIVGLLLEYFRYPIVLLTAGVFVLLASMILARFYFEKQRTA